MHGPRSKTPSQSKNKSVVCPSLQARSNIPPHSALLDHPVQILNPCYAYSVVTTSGRRFSTLTTIIKMTFKPFAQVLFVAGMVAGLAIASPSPAALTVNKTESSPTDAVKGAIIDLVQVLDDETLKQPGQAARRRHKIEAVIKDRMDYEEMARRALGAPFSTLSPRDQKEFVGLFVQLLRDAFAGRMAERSDGQVVFLGEFRDDAFAEVKARMQGRKIDTPVEFRLVHYAQEWRVYDVVIDGASIVSNYRSQFTSIIRDVSYVGLVKKMKQKAVAVKFFENSPVP